MPAFGIRSGTSIGGWPPYNPTMVEEDIVMPMESELGELILKRTPYKKMELMDGWKDAIEWDARPILWQFREVSRRVNKALRIPVCITYHNEATGQDETYLDWLLIGYEGGSF